MHCTFTKRQIAHSQIQHALECFSTHQDYISTITLAGAAEEICGKALKRRKITHALDDQIRLLQAIERKLGGPETKTEDWIAHLNRPSNELKHWSILGISEVTADWREEARAMLDRAITNYMTLYEDHVTDEMHAFIVTSFREESDDDACED